MTEGAYRDALGVFATGVTVVLAEDDAGKMIGITANSFSSVSLSPRLVSWCIDHKSERYPVFSTAARYSINVLAANQQKISDFCASNGVLQEMEFQTCRLTEGHAPVITEALAQFDCKLFARHTAGDHDILVGEVVAFNAQEGAALTFFRGQYGAL